MQKLRQTLQLHTRKQSGKRHALWHLLLESNTSTEGNQPMSARKLNDILDKLERLERKIENLESKSRKRNLHWKAAIPPLQLCKDVVTAFNSGLFQTFEYEMRQLADYYGIAPMENYLDEKQTHVPKNAIASYHPYERAAYYKEPVANLETLLHEFYHHLENEGVVPTLNDREKIAGMWANIVIQRGRMS